MKLKVQNKVQKHFHIRSYSQLEQLKNAMISIKKEGNINSQLSILGKFSNEQVSKDDKKTIDNANTIKDYWIALLGTSTAFGFFNNAELGTVFIVGSLTPLFLHKIDSKVLGEMSTGLYGILRGLGAYRLQTETYLKALKTGSFLLILRGFDDELAQLEASLDTVE